MLKGDKGFHLPEVEQKVLTFWRERDIFKKSLALREKSHKKGKNFVFYEGPPTANGRPGVHHVLARAYKDIILRFRAMRGYYVLRRAGWDTQGLPVEIEAEKTLGLKNKQAIEEYGIAAFNKVAKESVWKYKEEWENLTERIGFWLDFDSAYVTYENSYLESLWWIFKQIDDQGLLKKSYKVIPYCARCATPLSSHELGQPGVYRKVQDPSVFVRFPLIGKKDESLLIWTTTPWTLPSNAAVAINPDLTYKRWKITDEFGGTEIIYSIYKPSFFSKNSIEEIGSVSGKDLVGLKYSPPYKNKGIHIVLAAPFVSGEDGTGFVHIAPAYGEDDFNLMKERGFEDIPFHVGDDGHLFGDYPGKGKWIKDADKDILTDLKERHLLFYRATIDHEYPHCWRCSSPLLYMARRSWFIEMSRLRKELVKRNKKINWYPDYVKEGRFGNWIKDAKDWAISRDRYWGTPLPIWECKECNSYQVIGSLADLEKNSPTKNSVYFMRHGEATHNITDTFSAGPVGNEFEKSAVLSEKGKKEVLIAAKKLRSKKISLIISSPYIRTKETTELVQSVLGENIKVMFDDRLIEHDHGYFNGRYAKEIWNYFSSYEERFEKRPPQGESFNDVRSRVIDLLKDINKKYKNENILLVSHGNPLLMLETACAGTPETEVKSFSKIKTGEVRLLSHVNLPFNEVGALDLHRPFIDDVPLVCDLCGKTAHRIREVADIWFDSGSMPLASWHYPFENKSLINSGEQYPADYICEAMDQTRGWFYTLLSIATLLKKPAPFKNVISVGLILDKNGEKMSKSKGNVVSPWELSDKYGVDALRFYLYSINPPGEAKRFDETDLGKVGNRIMTTLYNSFVFYDTYALKNIEIDWKKEKLTNILDRWILARFESASGEMTKLLEKYDVHEATKVIDALIDDLSRWYIRRSRKRFQQPIKNDHRIASAVLYRSLLTLVKLMAPFTPFISEALYQALKKDSDPESVHFLDYPVGDKTLFNKELVKSMGLIRDYASSGLSARQKAALKVRQPLASLSLKIKKSPFNKKDETALLDILRDEVNVKKIIFSADLKEEVVLDTKLTEKLKREGYLREISRLVQGLRQEAGFSPKDQIILYATGDDYLVDLMKSSKSLKKSVGAATIEFRKVAGVKANDELLLDNYRLWLGIK